MKSVGLAEKRLPAALVRVVSELHRAGFQAFAVGGAVRDLLIGRPVADWDIATNAKPQQVMRLFKRALPTGIKHGTVTVLFEGDSFEVTTFRQDGQYEDGRHPSRVNFVDSIEADLSRRDFTINAIALEVEQMAAIDPFGGRDDLAAKVIRTVGEPEARFAEDGLRLLRAARFAAQLDFSIDTLTFEAMCSGAELIDKISRERVRDEFVKVLMSKKPRLGLSLLQQSGLLRRILPELDRCCGFVTDRACGVDLLDHQIRVLEILGQQGAPLVERLAALFHDLGRPMVVLRVAEKLTFPGYEVVSARLAEALMRRLVFSKSQIRQVEHLIEHHAIDVEHNWSPEELRRFIALVGPHTVESLWSLRRADLRALDSRGKMLKNLVNLESKLIRQLNAPVAYELHDLALDGEDVQRICHLEPGKQVGELLQQLWDLVLQNPQLNEVEILTQVLIDVHGRRFS